MDFFNTIIKRVANFSIQSFDSNKNNITNFFETNELFNLCVLTASGSLYDDINKNKSLKTEGSLYNYFVRSHFNPTPFGVFNSVGILDWGDSTTITKTDKMRFMVKYDNLFISSKINDKIKDNWQHSTFCSNPSIFFLNDKKIGFYKSVNTKNDSIEISYAEIDFDEDLLWLLNQFNNGKKISLVIEEIINQGFELPEVEAFLSETIESGIIIESFLFNPFASKLNNPFENYLSNIVLQKEHLIGDKKDIINIKETIINEQNNFFEEKEKPKDFYAINSFNDEKGYISKDVQNLLKKYIDFVVQYNMQNNHINASLEKFINKVKDKYNDGFVSINTVFNPYSGINYNDIKNENETKLSEKVIMKILTSCENILYLNLPTDENAEIKAKKLPATFSIITEALICKISNEPIIYIKSLGFSSALDLISRFSDVTQNACEEIIIFEREVNKNKIVADINCVGNYRSINIAPIEQRFDYVLPINSSYSAFNNPILLSDVYVHLHNNNFSLVSKKHQKQILPKRVSAINSKVLDSAVYNFLSNFELYNQEIHSVNFNFNNYHLRQPYVPRIFLEKGILLYPAQMLLVFDNFSQLEFEEYLQQKISANSFSKKLIISENHREVILDTEDSKNLVLLYNKLKSTKHIYVTEFIYDYYEPTIKNGSENFAHELVVSVKNPYYTRPDIDYSKMNFTGSNSENVAVVSDWLYLELFCNIYADSTIFDEIFIKIIEEEKTDKFFFVNYANPDRHLRLRFKTKSIDKKQYIISIIHNLKVKNIISKYHVLPYEQETIRYGGKEMMAFAETIFDLDSRDFLKNISNKDFNVNVLRTIAILKLQNYLQFLNFSLENAIDYCEQCILNYSKEFELTGQLRKDFNKEYSEIKNNISNYEYGSFFRDESFKENYHQQIKNSNVDVFSNTWLLIHMSMNRHFNENQRFNEFKIYYLTKCYLNQLKFQKSK